MSSDSPISDATEGAVKGALDFGKEQLEEFVKKIMNKELAFIEDEETINTVKAQREKPEFKIYRKYIKDTDLKLQIQMGFTLRELKKQEQAGKFDDLRAKIVRKYGAKGLHVSELVQCSLLSRYAYLVIGSTITDKIVEERIEELLGDIEKYVVFIQSVDTAAMLKRKVLTKIDANSPNAILIFSNGKKSISMAEKLIKSIRPEVQGYTFETQLEEETGQRYDFIIRV